jgi:hypothetical protein
MPIIQLGFRLNRELVAIRDRGRMMLDRILIYQINHQFLVIMEGPSQFRIITHQARREKLYRHPIVS